MAQESKLQTRIKNELVKSGWFVTKLIATSTPGINDLLALKYPARSVWIEVKAPGCKPTELQLHIHEKLRKMGFEVIVADDLKYIQHLL